ncbi:uroporphyrinogen-III synthase [Planctomicrobium sp. SH527]|uniref:uroporphyrinogen-III synthase n=1 Tax=Planctomicrobium sp. SH527 TaxID=3448123 RepID=UPI003F5C7276
MSSDTSLNDRPVLRVCSFESRRREEMEKLIEKSRGIPTVAPSMKEIPLTDNGKAFEFANELLNNTIDAVVFMTGVGAEALMEALATQGLAQQVQDKLKTTTTIARGPKPVAALSKMGIRVTIRAPEPNTWQDMTSEIVKQNLDLAGKRIAVQEYGEPSHDFYQWLQEHGAEVIPVPVYKWALPDDLAPLEESIRKTIAGEFEILLWTSAQQINHVLEVAERMQLKDEWLAAAQTCVIGSIGPTASERLRGFQLPPDLEPSHPKMAHLIRESIAVAPAVLSSKRSN